MKFPYLYMKKQKRRKSDGEQKSSCRREQDEKKEECNGGAAAAMAANGDTAGDTRFYIRLSDSVRIVDCIQGLQV